MIFEPLESRRLLSITLVNGTLRIVGTSSDDRIDVIKTDNPATIAQFGVAISVRINVGETASFPDDQVQRIEIDARGGNDFVSIERKNDARPATILGGEGNDLLSGSAGTDFLHGGAGRDQLWGG